MKTIKSKQGTLQGRDYLNGVGIGVATALVVALVQFAQGWLSDGKSLLDISWADILNAAIGGLIAYLGKNIVEPSKVGVIQAEGKEARELIAAKEETNPPPMGDPTHPKKPKNP